MAELGPPRKKPKRERGTPNKPKEYDPKRDGWEASLGCSQSEEYTALAAALNQSFSLLVEMTRSEYTVLQLTEEQLRHCYQLCMQNTNQEMVWVGSGRDTCEEKKRFDNKNQPRVSVTVDGVQIKVVASHVVLVHNGHRPVMPGLQASHYCHNAACMQHLVWEPRHYNEKLRKRCAKAKKCTCSLMPACDLTLHADIDSEVGNQ